MIILGTKTKQTKHSKIFHYIISKKDYSGNKTK